ncbi:MAG: hypothetical protein WCO52_00745 [bacterium]
MNTLHSLCIRAARLVTIIALVTTFGIQTAFAGSVTSQADTLSDYQAAATGVHHVITFTTATTSDIQRVAFQFSTVSAGTTKPSHLSLSSATLGTVSGLGSGWSLNTASAGDGLIYIGRDTPAEVTASSSASVDLQNITNPHIADCNSGTINLSDTCYVAITTFSDDSHTHIDSGETTYVITEDPSFSFQISSVPVSQTHNGVTTTVAGSGTEFPFGNMSPGNVQYAAHKLQITTNAPRGYTVYAYLNEPISGSNPDNQISPFGAVDATWSTPQNWATPSGTSANSNSGWIAANTSDTRVSGWSSASAKFGPISTTKHAVATSTTADRTEVTIYVSYAFGINAVQPADTYSGKIIYEVDALY